LALEVNLEKLVVVATALFVAYSLALSLFGSIYLASAKNSKLGNTGSVEAQTPIGVYYDSIETTKLSSIDWGVLKPGQGRNLTSYVKNWGSSPLTLSLSTANWNPSTASQYISLNWNYTGQPIRSSEAIPVAFSLAVSKNASGVTNFSFDIIIVANSGS
jgi:hypothetical protein